ncbi:MAG: DUF2087 domain-containing protein [Gammaproteobacteria bacterium]|jgi:hypothetical protein|nr:DUF2087 domain-containing protein [Gammaproteobacteria bacterium]MBT3870815.1 DUF2087 domain-containing protein [Gammaproteobacteria bacterium]MBT4380243.1 DUF2087 domain-containing protein [Gammaproteobacteria bacterium]MBT4615206.1 DUF2087 domain-containing protein [Gammaproteobacteria bacterium]MBT5197772.1 DUF2087 domain-containing protein [Gammaproteobacteria bacterium]
MERAAIISLLRRTFKGGILQRLPKKRQDAEVFLALSLVGLDPAAFYEESEINVHLAAFLDIIASQEGSSDHITLRRYLVDLGFLRRATDGAVYRVSSERIDEVLPRNARDIDPKALFREVEMERLRRRREH